MSSYPEAYIRYLVHFHADRDWFECHEILEEYWKSFSKDQRSKTWVGLIQVAVGLYHHRRGNLAGATKMLQSAIDNLEPTVVNKLGLDAERLDSLIKERCSILEDPLLATKFEDMDLPIHDPELIHQCIEQCRLLGLEWGTPSMLDEPNLIHKHTLRDRSDVIEARQAESERRRQLRGSDS